MNQVEKESLVPGLELNEKVATILGESKPDNSLLDFDIILCSGQLSPKGLWYGVSMYEEGDIPRWQPLDFSGSDEVSFKWLWPFLFGELQGSIHLSSRRCGDKVEHDCFITRSPTWVKIQLQPTVALALCAAVLAQKVEHQNE